MNLIFFLTLLLAGLLCLFAFGLVHRQIHIWFWSYLRHGRRVNKIHPVQSPVHVMFCFVDHYEPYTGGTNDEHAKKRVDRWVRDYPALARRFHDADGRPPAHGFFYPEEEYRPELVDSIAKLCQQGFGEIEIHLHHDNDTADKLRAKLEGFLRVLDERHGAVSEVNGSYRYAFIHGNWALDNSRADGRWCGVNNELIVLRDTGCYADFTLPSAPSDTQTRTVNSIYYATDDPLRPKSHDTGQYMKAGESPVGDLLIFQGPLALNWRYRRFGIWPRIENGDIAPCDIPIEGRVDLWVRQHIHVHERPEWIFIKVHTHGAIEENADFLFGGELERLFSHLEHRYNDGSKYRLHYVTAREAYNIAKAAEAGLTGNPNSYRDYQIPAPPMLSKSGARTE